MHSSYTVPAYEDKLVQSSLSKILGAIYEEDFLPWSFGFRPGRSVHHALQVLDHILMKKPIHYVVDADIKGFSDINLGLRLTVLVS